MTLSWLVFKLGLNLHKYTIRFIDNIDFSLLQLSIASADATMF